MLEPSPLEPGHRTKEVFVFMAIDPKDNSEGIVGYEMQGSIIPLVAADRKRVESYMPFARKVARATGQEIKLVRFGSREDVEVVKP